jgi:polar amino acid transport system substrate-binding protein
MEMKKASVEALGDLAPNGTVRAAINFGNGVLVQGDRNSEADPKGVAPALARALAEALAARLEFVRFARAGDVFDALAARAWDVCFLAIEPVRAAQISFSPPYVEIEGTYLVPEKSSLREIGDVDRPGVRIAVAEKSAYDLYLMRTLKHAKLLRAVGTTGAFDLLRGESLEAMAGVRQPLNRLAETNEGFRVMPERFTAIRQAMGLPTGKEAGARYLHDFVEAMKSSGFVAQALVESGQGEVSVAPPFHG